MKAGWDVEAERYLRIEAECLWDQNRPQLNDVDSDLARSVFIDRFGAVGRGTLVLKGTLVEPLMELLRAGTITAGQYEQLYAFLDHSRMGLADALYGRDTRHRRARLARSLALEVPGLEDRPLDGLDAELDVRGLVHEIARAF